MTRVRYHPFMLALLLLLFLAVSACSNETVPLDPGAVDGAVAADGGIQDAAVVRDAGLADSGIADAGDKRCAPVSPGFSLAFDTNLDSGTVEGRARIVSVAPLTFVFEDTGTRIEVRWAPPVAINIEPQSMRAWVRLEIYRPFWTEGRITVRNLDPSDGPGALLFVAWEGSRYGSVTERDMTYRYADADCSIADDGCGEQNGQDLILTVDGADVVAPYGQSTRTDDGWAVYNGRSARYLNSPSCPDTPDSWHAGVVVAERFPALRCRELRDDTCISIGGCVLFGEQFNDGGYRCEPAVGDCESLPGRDGCLTGDRCLWFSGECYCPEFEVCACGGGRPPKCRSRCEDPSTPCPTSNESERYCAPTTSPPPACGISSAAIVCDWRPSSCMGVQGPAQCGCSMSGPMTYANDCERRRAGAGAYRAGACP